MAACLLNAPLPQEAFPEQTSTFMRAVLAVQVVLTLILGALADGYQGLNHNHVPSHAHTRTLKLHIGGKTLPVLLPETTEVVLTVLFTCSLLMLVGHVRRWVLHQLSVLTHRWLGLPSPSSKPQQAREASHASQQPAAKSLQPSGIVPSPALEPEGERGQPSGSPDPGPRPSFSSTLPGTEASGTLHLATASPPHTPEQQQQQQQTVQQAASSGMHPPVVVLPLEQILARVAEQQQVRQHSGSRLPASGRPSALYSAAALTGSPTSALVMVAVAVLEVGGQGAGSRAPAKQCHYPHPALHAYSYPSQPPVCHSIKASEVCIAANGISMFCHHLSAPVLQSTAYRSPLRLVEWWRTW
jgi:hypothetical protein